MPENQRQRLGSRLGLTRLHRADHRDGVRRRILLLPLAAALTLTGVPAAGAQEELPPGSGVDQYVESLPGAGGGTVPGSEQPSRSGQQALPAATEAQLSQDVEGNLLRRVATDLTYGAPGTLAPGRENGSRTSGGESVPTGVSDSLSVPTAVSDSFLAPTKGLPVLIGALLITAAGLVAAYRRGLRRGIRTAANPS